MKPRQTKLPHPRKARIAAGLKWRALAAAAQVSTATISACEKSGKYPRQRAIRASYLAALGLCAAPPADVSAVTPTHPARSA